MRDWFLNFNLQFGRISADFISYLYQNIQNFRLLKISNIQECNKTEIYMNLLS